MVFGVVEHIMGAVIRVTRKVKYIICGQLRLAEVRVPQASLINHGHLNSTLEFFHAVFFSRFPGRAQ